MGQLKPEEVIIAAIAEGEAQTSGFICFFGSLVTLATFETSAFMAETGHTLPGTILAIGASASAALNVRSFFRARSFRERDLEIRGLSREHTRVALLDTTEDPIEPTLNAHCANVAICHQDAIFKHVDVEPPKLDINQPHVQTSPAQTDAPGNE